MRHRKKRTRFGRQSSHRKSTLKALARAVFLHQRIKTTRTKAKEASRLVEHLITIAKNDSVASRRKVFSVLGEDILVRKLFKEIVPLFSERQSGYTRLIHFNFRKGDGANIVFLELTEKKPEEKRKAAKKGEKPERPRKAKPAKQSEHPKAAPEVAPKIKEEKSIEWVKKEKAKRESRKIEKQKGFLKKVHGFFHRKTNM